MGAAGSLQGMLNSLGAMGIVGTVVIGLVAGIVAKIIMPGETRAASLSPA